VNAILKKTITKVSENQPLNVRRTNFYMIKKGAGKSNSMFSSASRGWPTTLSFKYLLE
jgi:hypothetical protein